MQRCMLVTCVNRVKKLQCWSLLTFGREAALCRQLGRASLDYSQKQVSPGTLMLSQATDRRTDAFWELLLLFLNNSVVKTLLSAQPFLGKQWIPHWVGAVAQLDEGWWVSFKDDSSSTKDEWEGAKSKQKQNHAPSMCTKCRSSSIAEAMSIKTATANDMFELHVAITLRLAQ